MRTLVFAGITSLIVVSAGAFSSERLEAQCWDCEVQYYPGDDCWMEGCWVTYGHGAYTSCGQQGTCDAETCTTSGEICLPHQTLLDGRNTGWMAPTALDLLVELGASSISVADSEKGRLYRSICSGTVVYADYAVADLAELRREARRIEL